MTIILCDYHYLTASKKKDLLEITPTRVWGYKTIIDTQQIVKHDFPNTLPNGAEYIQRVDL